MCTAKSLGKAVLFVLENNAGNRNANAKKKHRACNSIDERLAVRRREGGVGVVVIGAVLVVREQAARGHSAAARGGRVSCVRAREGHTCAGRRGGRRRRASSRVRGRGG